jgi:hypothetical protein
VEEKVARQLINTFTVASSSAVQLLGTDKPRVMALQFKARPSNVGGIYVGDDSHAASSKGFELQPGDMLDWSFEPATVKGTTWWVSGSDVDDAVDWTAVLED